MLILAQIYNVIKDYLSVPPGYDLAAKFEWFVNGTLVKTSTNPTDPTLNWIVVSKPTSVYCKVTYKKLDGTLSVPYTSTTFTPKIKDLDFPLTITALNSPPNYGCAGGTVSYSLNETPCSGSGICDFVYNVSGQYNITWQAPAGWVQTSISANGSNVSFTPDASSAGTLTATIHLLQCAYTETRTFNITRTAQAPTFTTSNIQACTSSASASITPTCGAIDYTYTIVGNSGVKFTSNNQQILTTASTTVAVSTAGGSSLNSIKVKANYPNSISSAESGSTLTVGTPPPGTITIHFIDPVTGKLFVTIQPVPGALSYNWYMNGLPNTQTEWTGTAAHFDIQRNKCDIEYDISVEAVSSCGVSSQSHINAYASCDNLFVVYPNPATTTVSVSSDESKSLQTSEGIFIDAIRIYDKLGNLKKYQNIIKLKKQL